MTNIYDLRTIYDTYDRANNVLSKLKRLGLVTQKQCLDKKGYFRLMNVFSLSEALHKLEQDIEFYSNASYSEYGWVQKVKGHKRLLKELKRLQINEN